MKNNFIYLTLFPQYFHNYFEISLAKKAYQQGLLDYKVFNLKDFAARRQVTDYPFGGGHGMLLKIEPLLRGLAAIKKNHHDCYSTFTSRKSF
jgi:tRNA (guanine37-N1)-methyltransferase